MGRALSGFRRDINLLPEDQIARCIGHADVKAHGPPDMQVMSMSDALLLTQIITTAAGG